MNQYTTTSVVLSKQVLWLGSYPDEVEHGSGLRPGPWGPFLNGEASHIGEFRPKGNSLKINESTVLDPTRQAWFEACFWFKEKEFLRTSKIVETSLPDATTEFFSKRRKNCSA